MPKQSIGSIATKPSHWLSPFTFKNPTTELRPLLPNEISRRQKISSIALAIIIGIPTLGMACIPAFLLLTAYFKSRTINRLDGSNQLKLSIHPPIAPSQPSGSAVSSIENYGLPEIPADGVKMKLINLGQSCWWNTILKMLATTQVYDGLFDIDVSTLDKTEKEKQDLSDLQDKLMEMVSNMRRANKNEVVNAREYRELLQALDRAFPGNQYLTDANSSNIVLGELLAGFDYPPENESRGSPISNELKKFCVEDVSLRYAKGSYHTGTSQILNERRAIASKIALPPNLYNGRTVDISSQRAKLVEERSGYDYQILPTHLPDDLLIDITISAGDTLKVAMDKQARMSFVEYDRSTFKPKYTCEYQVVGAFANNPGHAYYIERTSLGRYIKHDDSRIETLSTEQGLCQLQNGFVLILKRLGEKIPL